MRVTGGRTLDEVLSGPEEYRDHVRERLDDIFMDCVDTPEDIKLAEELDDMIIHFEPGDREATWEDSPDMADDLIAFAKEHCLGEYDIPLATETPEELARRIANDIDRLNAGEITLPEEDTIADGYEVDDEYASFYE